MNSTRTHLALDLLRRSFHESASKQTDLDLLTRFVAGDEHAFAMLVHRHGRMVLGVCRGVLHNRADAEDVFQAVFLALARKAGHPFSGACLGAWLNTVARRASIKLRNSEARRRICERDAGERDLSPPSGHAELREVLDEEVSRLPARCREAILRCFFHGQTREQAAGQLGWSLRTLDRRLEQGRQILRERLTARGTTLGVLLAVVPAAVPSALADLTVRAALSGGPGKIAQLAGAAVSGISAVRWKLALSGMLMAALAVGAGLMLPAKKDSLARVSVSSGLTAKRLAASIPESGEKPLPENAIARLGSTQFRHGFLVHQLAYSKDGKILASVGNGRNLCMWEATTGKLLHHCSAQRVPGGYALAIAPDCRTIADAEGSVVKLWSVGTGKELRKFIGHTIRVLSLAFAPGGDVLASADQDGTIRLWDPGTGRELHVLNGHTSVVTALAFRDDGKVLASASGDGTVRLWDPRSGTLLHVCKGHRKAVLALTFEPSGKRLVSCGSAGGVRLWDSDTGKPERILASEEGAAFSLAASPDGRTLAVGRGNRIVLHDFPSGKELRRWQAHLTQINSLAFAPDGKTLASGSHMDNTIRLWDPKTGHERNGVQGHFSAVHHLMFSKDGGRLFSISLDGRSLEWDLETRRSRSLASAWPVTSNVSVFSITNDRKTLALTNRQPAKSLIEHLTNRQPAKSTDNLIIDLYDMATRKKMHSLSGHKGDVLVVAFDADGGRLVSLGKDRTVRAWQVATGVQLWCTQLPTGDQAGFPFFKPLAFSPDGKRVACAIDQTLYLLDAATGKEIRRYPYGHYAFDLAWTPDGSQVALASGIFSHEVGLWDAHRGQLVRFWNSPQASVLGFACSPDSRYLATGGDFDGSVYVWELATGGKVAAFEGRQCCAMQLAFAPDNRTLASGGGDSSIVLWDLTGRVRDGKLPPVKVSAARFTPLWEKLAVRDAAVAHAAIWELVAGGKAVLPLLKAHLSVVALDARQAAKLVERLHADDFRTRENAMKEAEKLGLGAEPALRRALGDRPNLEPRRRVDALVAGWLSSPDWLRYRRAVAVLEYNGSDEAKEILASLARGAEGARPTKEAAAALARLRARR